MVPFPSSEYIEPVRQTDAQNRDLSGHADRRTCGPIPTFSTSEWDSYIRPAHASYPE